MSFQAMSASLTLDQGSRGHRADDLRSQRPGGRVQRRPVRAFGLVDLRRDAAVDRHLHRGGELHSTRPTRRSTIPARRTTCRPRTTTPSTGRTSCSCTPSRRTTRTRATTRSSTAKPPTTTTLSSSIAQNTIGLWPDVDIHGHRHRRELDATRRRGRFLRGDDGARERDRWVDSTGPGQIHDDGSADGSARRSALTPSPRPISATPRIRPAPPPRSSW